MAVGRDHPVQGVRLRGRRRAAEDAYRAADKKTKTFWLVVLGIALGLDLLFGANFIGSFLTLAGLVAAIVYMVDVRPAIKALTGGRGGKDDRRNMGPYGPW